MGLLVDIEKDLGSFGLRASFAVESASEVMALLGPSGSGKSVTLRCVAGLMRPDRGRIQLGDRVLFDSERGIDLPPQQRRVGYLFQSYALFPTMTVLQNVMAGVREGTRDERRRKALEQIAAFRLGGLEDRRPGQLSGGQQQRVALARIMASAPEVLLLDEPFSALDGHLRWQLELELAQTLRGFPGGCVMVSHNRDEVYRMCDTVCVIDGGHTQGKVPMERLFSSPGTLAAALISGCKNVSGARVVAPGRLACDDWGVELGFVGDAPSVVTHAGIRAHYLRVAGAGDENLIPCTVDRVIQSTFSTIVMLATPGRGQLRWELEKDAWDALGNPSQVTLAADPADVMPLHAEGDEA